MKHTPPPPPADSVPVAHIRARIDTILAARTQLQSQLLGLENQLYALNQLLTPTPEGTHVEAVESDTEAGLPADHPELPEEAGTI